MLAMLFTTHLEPMPMGPPEFWKPLPLQFADLTAQADAFLLFRCALTVVGAGIFLLGLVMFFYRPRAAKRPTPFSARLTALICFGLIGMATTVYAWLWFGY